MIKMPCVFVREFHGRDSFTITDRVTPGCEWVLAAEEASASRKRDGTACAFIGSQLFKRYDAKRDRKTGEYKLPPDGAIPCSEPDPVTGHWPHWTLITPTDYWHHEAFKRQLGELVDGATYELCGPKLQGNPEGLSLHTLTRHGSETVYPPHSFAGLKNWLEAFAFEGVVFRHEDGRFAKLRRSDFGFEWPLIRCTDSATNGGNRG